ncbi:MAG: hypothetical protein ACI9UQ_001885 [Candidatus Krumholzibacteriia bacterium]|jgi:hypothetical protein
MDDEENAPQRASRRSWIRPGLGVVAVLVAIGPTFSGSRIGQKA